MRTIRCKVFEDDRKICYVSETAGLIVQYFKDPANAYEEASGSGALDSRISGYLMECLNQMKIGTHFVRRLNMRELLVQEVEPVPVSVVSHTVASKNLADRLGIEEGITLSRPLLEFYYHPNRSNGQCPVLIGEDHIRSFSW
ncbi:MAG: phosphoribosylaminoimidazolesuccinocarboxamide synthase, partial [Holosporales bacterium]|nr:phosphoribosylaminoimidazolesuccinocarboxamide synthase [Holosporales bacterium]